MRAKLIFSLLSVFLMPGLAQAVATKQCPQRLTISYESLSPLSDKELIDEKLNEIYDDAILPYVKSVRDGLTAAPTNAYQNRVYTLVSTKRSQCDYKLENGLPNEKAPQTRVLTRNGTNYLRVALQIPGSFKNYYFPNEAPHQTEEVWAYHRIKLIEPTSVILEESNGSRILALFDHGSPKFTVGFARGASVIAK